LSRKFPYQAFSVTENKKRVFNNIDDVYDEIGRLYDDCKNSDYGIGYYIYSHCGYFVDYELLLCPKIQSRIKEYNFCKAFSCPPYPSLYETPANIVDDFMIIEDELRAINEKNKVKPNVSK
jgi:hypothetical protein